MNGKWLSLIIGILFFIFTFFILLDHYFLTGIWFEVEDVHHETFVLSTAAMGIGVLIGAILSGSKN